MLVQRFRSQSPLGSEIESLRKIQTKSIENDWSKSYPKDGDW